MSKRSKLKMMLVLIPLLGLISIYAFIPGTLSMSGKVYAHALDQSLYTTLRNLTQTGTKSSRLLLPSIQSASFAITEVSYPYFNLHSLHQEGSGRLEIIPTPIADSTIIVWEWKVATGFNPIRRINAFFRLQRLKDSINTFTKNLALYASQTQNTYGLKVESSNITDTLIATVSQNFASMPTTEMICQLVGQLQHELKLASMNSRTTIMLSQRLEDNKYIIMAGIPVAERPTFASTVKMKKINPSKLLSGIVQGGAASIQMGYLHISRYIMDRNIEEAGIPYEIPLTDRCTEKDTAKWQTKICYPVY